MKRLFPLLLAFLFALPVGAGTLDDLRAEGVLTLYHDYRSSAFADWSWSGNDGTPTGMSWQGKGLYFDADTSKVQASAGDIVGTGADSFVAVFLPHTPGENNEGRLLSNGETDIYLAANGQISLTSDGFTTTLTTVIDKYDLWRMQTFGFSRDAAGAAVIYVDGVSVGSGASGTPVGGSGATVVGAAIANNRECHGIMLAAALVSRELTGPEHVALHAELPILVWPSKSASHGRGSYGAELLTDWDMETAGFAAWSVIGGTLTKETGNVLSGSQVLRITKTGAGTASTYQSVTTIGERYRILGWGMGDGGGNTYPRISPDGSNVAWTGTNSTTPQYFDIVFTAVTTTPLLACAAGGAAEWAEFDNVSIRKVEADEVQWKSGWGVNISIGPES